jgi:hypothetical protein
MLIILFSVNILYSQQIGKISAKNVIAKSEQDKVIINYDLIGSTDITYTVSIFLIKAQNEELRIKLKNLSGDVGEGKLSGTNRTITWYYHKDIDEKIVSSDILEQDIKFYVEAEYIKPPETDTGKNVEPVVKQPDSGISPMWYYVGGAALVVGGVTAFILSNSKKEESIFPKPPGKPE